MADLSPEQREGFNERFHAENGYYFSKELEDMFAPVVREMLADAWDEGHAVGHDCGTDVKTLAEHQERVARNPYRKEGGS